MLPVRFKKQTSKNVADTTFKGALFYRYGNKVDLDIAATSALDKSKLPLGDKINFREECIKFAIEIISKLKEGCPLKYKFTRACSAMLPSLIFRSSEKGKNCMFDLLIALHNSGNKIKCL